MRVQAPPSRCRSESVAPGPATGSQRSEAGINGGNLEASIRVSRLAGIYGQRKRRCGGAIVKRNQRKRLSRWSHKAQEKAPAAGHTDRYALPRNPVESTVLRMRAMGTGNGVTSYVLSDMGRSRCQPQGVWGGIPQEANAGGNASDSQT